MLGERAALVIPGTAQVQQLYPGTIEGVWGAAGVFPITFWETALTLGIVALVALLFVLGLKFLPLLPEAGESGEEPESGEGGEEPEASEEPASA